MVINDNACVYWVNAAALRPSRASSLLQVKDTTSSAPATLGEGCLSRYDPDALSPEDGTDFPDAARLWDELQQDSNFKPHA